jgi:hypothetical protein
MPDNNRTKQNAAPSAIVTLPLALVTFDLPAGRVDGVG